MTARLLGSAWRIFLILNLIKYLLKYLIRNEHNYSKFSNTYHHQFLIYLTEWRRFFTVATTPSNQQNQQTQSHLLAHYGPPSTETPTTETTTVRCNTNRIYLTSTYYWWLLRPMITIRFNFNYSIWFEMKKNTICTALLLGVRFLPVVGVMFLDFWQCCWSYLQIFLSATVFIATGSVDGDTEQRLLLCVCGKFLPTSFFIHGAIVHGLLCSVHRFVSIVICTELCNNWWITKLKWLRDYRVTYWTYTSYLQ